MKYKIIYFLFILFSVSSLGFSQDCTDYHQFHCTYADYTFYYSRQSKSALFERGQISELRIVAYGGEEYYVSVCANRKWKNMRFRILEDNENRTVLYDNADNEYAEDITFENENTRNIIIEVITPEPESASEVGEQRCVGVVIMFRPKDHKEQDPEGKIGF
ncbi:MAG: hypothetical protein GVY19_01810 [Bacteroidetes bacterium]|jgi:hypothetical protein|nr:hypothetical protein [Bacteroidota bacterium]